MNIKYPLDRQVIVERGRIFCRICSLLGGEQRQRSLNIYILTEQQGLVGLFLNRRQLEQIV